MEGVSPSHLFVINLTLAGQSLHSDNELTLFIHDALQFISVFIVPISQRAPHVYLSALPLAPEKSHVARKFCPRVPNTLAITQGKPSLLRSSGAKTKNRIAFFGLNSTVSILLQKYLE